MDEKAQITQSNIITANIHVWVSYIVTSTLFQTQIFLGELMSI